MNRSCQLLGILLVAITGAAALAAEGDEAQLKDLVIRLRHADFSVRDAAQKELDKINWRSLPALKTVTALELDVEAAARLKTRITDLEEATYFDPYPISLDLEAVPLASVAAELTKVTGVKFETANDNASERYTLRGKDKPFWEVIRELSRQNPFNIQSSGNVVRLVPNQAANMNRMVFSGPVAILPQVITRTRRTNLAAQPAAELENEQISLQYQVLVDPRVRLISYRQPILTEVIDSNGNNIVKNRPAAVAGLVTMTQRAPMMATSYSMPLDPVPRPAAALASVKISFALIASVDELSVTFDDAQKKVGENLTVGNATFRLQRFDVRDTSLSLQVIRENAPLNPGESAQPGTFEILDGNNQRLVRYVITSGTVSTSSAAQAFTPPFKFRAAIPLKTREVPHTFELKDLPLP